ncbi:MAG: SusD/RagB family nutrient-binding outer membrane lipoprotein [Flavobacteriaceae bacterium]|nr:SusD/RagB family nutrient-binding outer membrane lipoprotein [Flavobacteriaceae bacterium]
MSNNYLDLLNAGDGEAPFIETGTPDPRVRYYLYRQSSSEPSGSNLPCAGDATYDYCYVGNLYWGRGHGDDAGIPNDNTKRTTFGVYPGGGSFDRDLFEQARGVSESLEGAGILPILTSSFSNFILAEASVSLNINAGSTVSLLEKGIRASMAKATGFVGSLSTINPDTSEDFGATNAQINSYVNDVISEFNGASNDSERLAIVAREHYLSTWGNGVEGYNLYKRTGFPVLQSSIRPTGPFPRSFRYPDVETENNPNISQQEVTSRVFWDNNPAGFVD